MTKQERPGATHIEYATRNVVVHEHRAPTDQSVALLREFKASAEREIIAAVHVGGATFECVVHVIHEAVSDRTLLRAVFKLNGHTETAEHSFRPRNPGDEATAAVALRDKVAHVIAERMISDAFGRLSHSTLA